MKIQDKDLDAIELIKNIKQKERELRDLIATLEYVIYRTDERVEIKFFDERVRDGQ